ncbi:hypothetical protein BH10BDE1_BH10BDE1_20550 [soil metagenome]
MLSARRSSSSVVFIARTLLTCSLIFGANAQGKSTMSELGKPTSLKSEESASFKLAASTLEVTNEGYGHRITEQGDVPFVSFAVKSGSETSSLRFFTSKLPETQTWGSWSITVTKTADQGPPHDRQAPTEILVKAVRP